MQQVTQTSKCRTKIKQVKMCNTKATLHTRTANLSLINTKRHRFWTCARITPIMSTQPKKCGHTPHKTTRTARSCHPGHHKYQCQSKESRQNWRPVPTKNTPVNDPETRHGCHKEQEEATTKCALHAEAAGTHYQLVLTCRLSWVFEVHFLQKRLVAVPKFEQETEVLLLHSIQQPPFLQPSQVRTEVTGIE